LIGEAASVAKAVNVSKAMQRQLEELQRRDRAMEQGRDCISLRTNMGADCTSVRTNMDVGCNCKEKKMSKRQ